MQDTEDERILGTSLTCVGCLCCQNQLGILWAGRDETETAQGFLEKAESIYKRYMKEVKPTPCVAAKLQLLVG